MIYGKLDDGKKCVGTAEGKWDTKIESNNNICLMKEKQQSIQFQFTGAVFRSNRHCLKK